MRGMSRRQFLMLGAVTGTTFYLCGLNRFGGHSVAAHPR
jgi:hypothetical protein